MESEWTGPGRFRLTHIPSGVSHEAETDDLKRACAHSRVLLADGLHPDAGLSLAYNTSTRMNITDRLSEFKFERLS